MTAITSYAEILRVCGCAVLAAVCLLVLRGLDRSGISGAVSVCLCTVFALTALLAAEPAIRALTGFGGMFLDDSYASLLRRAMAIGMTVQLTADTVREAGEGAIADRVEFVGRAALLCTGFPLYRELLSLAAQLFGM